MQLKKVEKQIDFWKSKLIDTGKRNQLIHFKERKASTLRIIDPSFETLFHLLDHKNIEFAELFKDERDEFDRAFEEDDFDTPKQKSELIFGIRLEHKPVYEPHELFRAIENFKEKQTKKNKSFVFSNLSTQHQHTVLRTLMKKSKIFFDENAVHVLYLSIGMLKWYPSKDQEQPIDSPLLFLPIEIKQTHVDGPFQLHFLDNELSINESLHMKLSLEHGISLELGKDESKTEYEKCLDFFNHVKTQFNDQRWQVSPELFIGMFSFAKMNMVKDIESHVHSIKMNPIIQAFSGETSQLEPFGQAYKENDLDDMLQPGSTYQMLDSDSSQALAIQHAIAGKSFVLQGPPGTGKSQTITNIISELITLGKKVLFVAEKKAALDVVFQNLKKTGLDAYALPLHHTHLDKKSVVKDLNEELLKRQETPIIDDAQMDKTFQTLRYAKEKLSKYAKLLIEKHPPNQWSLYDLMGKFLSYDQIEDLRFDMPQILNIDHQKLNQINENIEGFYHAIKALEFKPKRSPFWGLNLKSYRISDVEAFSDLLEDLLNSASALRDVIALDTKHIFLSANHHFSDVKTLVKVYEHLSHVPKQLNSIKDYNHMESKLETLKQLIDLEEVKLSNFNQVLKSYHLEILKEDLRYFEDVFKQSDSRIKRWVSSTYKDINHQVSTYLKQKNRSHEEIQKDLIDLTDLKKAMKEQEQLYTTLKFDTSYHLMDLNGLKALYQALLWVIDLKTFYNDDRINSKEKSFEEVIEIISEGYNYLETYEKLNDAYNKVLVTFEPMENSFDTSLTHLKTYTFSSVIDLLMRMKSHIHELPSYITFSLIYRKAVDLGLKDFYDKIMLFKHTSHYNEIFYKRYYALLIDHYIHQQSTMHEFSKHTYEQLRNTFTSSDQLMMQYVKKQIDVHMAQRTPKIESDDQDVLFLRREAEKTRKILPIRSLFEKIPNLILTLKPCLMMSPLSVSSYLKMENYQFDTVIFDEASQIRPESAIGAIYRCKQAIIVGDKEQLPPTNFFETMEEETVDDEDFDAYQSVLEVASTVLKPISLNWHYRSKFEALIQPSYEHIYKNLITFPTVSQPSLYEGIDYVYVKGVYYRSPSKENLKLKGTNMIEAKEVVELIYDHYARFGHKRSIGVVTFSQAQQQAIEYQLYKARKNRPEFEHFFSEEKDEGLFIKNIETVQGDERDTIILSVGYGYDEKGSMTMNFGPLNKEGGYKRLNVAITRAKQNVKLVTSLKESDIDLTKTQSRGVAFLKSYVSFAQKSMEHNKQPYVQSVDMLSPFEKEVYEIIKSLGYDVHIKVGASSYKLDFAIVDPNDSKKYILGIECDGSIYQNNFAIRDKERLIKDVLEQRGWAIYRIWSTAWYKQRAYEIESLKDVIASQKSKETQKIETMSHDHFSEEKISNPQNEETTHFMAYPNYETLITSCSHLKPIEQILFVIKHTAPIHIDELKKISPAFYDRQKMSNFVELNFDVDLKQMIREKKVTKKDLFLFIEDQEIKFRIYEEHSSSKRSFDFIHSKEIAQGVKEVLKHINYILFDDLVKEMLKLTGHKKNQLKIKYQIEDLINRLHFKEEISMIDQRISIKK